MDIALDTNRLTYPAQRRFNAAWHEMEGLQVRILPQVARELTGHLILAEDIETGRRRVSEDLQRAGNRGPRYLQQHRRSALWWADELMSPDSVYRLLALTPEQENLADEVCGTIDPDAFPRILPDEVPENSDTRIIAQALVTGQRMLITSNMRSVLHHDVNRWAEKNADRFGFLHPDILHVQDEIMPRLYAGPEGRRKLLEFALGAVWPPDGDPTVETVGDSLYGLTRRAMMRGARLADTAVVIEESWETERDPQAVLERVRANLPARMMASEQRHPTWPGPRRHDRSAEANGSDGPP